MGVFSVEILVGDSQGERFEPVEALVDAGATYTVVPATLLERLNVEVRGKRRFLLADGHEIERSIGQTPLQIDGQTLTTIVVFAEEGARSLLGAVTLEEFGLGVDPVGRKLIPVPGYLM